MEIADGSAKIEPQNPHTGQGIISYASCLKTCKTQILFNGFFSLENSCAAVWPAQVNKMENGGTYS